MHRTLHYTIGDPDEPRPMKIQRTSDHIEQNEVFLVRTRVSTQVKTIDADEARKIATNLATKRTPTKDKLPRQIFSQKQLLSEALSTEVCKSYIIIYVVVEV